MYNEHSEFGVNEKLSAGTTPPFFETLPDSNTPLNSPGVKKQVDMTLLGRVVRAFAA
jgi:hypothetical protein